MQEVPVVLVVEDEEPLQDIVQDALKEGGFDLLIATSGDEALALLNGGAVKYSALVTDIRLKGDTNGWEVARQAREVDPSLAVVYITGSDGADWSSQGVPNSILVQKPFAPAQLVTAVSQLLNTATPIVDAM